MDPCSGSVVITDSKTGKVKALVSYPGYDSNRLSNGTDSGYYRQLANSASTPLYNQALKHKTAPDLHLSQCLLWQVLMRK